MTEEQIPKLVAVLVEHQSCFAPLSVMDAQWVIQNPKKAIALFVGALATDNIVAAIEAGRTELWLLGEDQKRRLVQGQEIYRYLNGHPTLLASCADLAELKAVQAKGINFYQRHFRGKAVFGWRGVQDDVVPYLIERNDEVLLLWHRLEGDLGVNSPALRRK